MKGILKIYHPDETLKYNIKSTYCKAVYSNQQHFLELEIITDDGLDHVDDDSLQYQFPQIALEVFDFPIDSDEIVGKAINMNEEQEGSHTSVDLFDDEDAFIYNNDLIFDTDEEGNLQLTWKGNIDDFYTGSDAPIPFRLKCQFKQDEIDIDED